LKEYTNKTRYHVQCVHSCINKNMHLKTSLKIPKGYSESVYRRTDTTMTKRKRTQVQTTTYKTNI